MKQNTQYRIAVTVVFTIASFCSSDTWADKIRPLNLQQITKSAHVIFMGECTAVKSGIDPESGLMATWYTFQIHDVYKGAIGDEYVLKQYGGTDGVKTVHVPTSQYKVGETLILFLYGKSRLGFNSAVGINQGKFQIQENTETNTKYVTNGMPALTLFEGMSTTIATLDSNGVQAKGISRLRSNKMDMGEFLSIVKSLVETEQQEKTQQKQ